MRGANFFKKICPYGSCIGNIGRSGTLDVQERSNRWAVLNVHSGQKYKDLKILWNQVHGTFKFTIQKRKKHCIFKRRFQQEPPKLESGGSIYRLEIIFSGFIIQKLEFYSSENNCFDRWFSEKRHFQRLLRPVFR